MACDIFLKIDGIKGEAQDKTHKDEIDVLAWSWGMSQSGTMHTGGGGGSGKVHVQDLSVTKYVDKATSPLIGACCSGKHIANATLTVRKAGGDSAVEYIVITMTDVLISSVSSGGSGGEDQLTENLSLNFAKVKYSYQPQKKDGSKDGGAIDTCWDIEQNVKC